jgi:hypothetical protein
VAAAVDDATLRDIDDLDEAGAGELAGAAGREVFGIAGEPKRIEPVLAGQRHQQTHRTCCVVMAAICSVDVEADVSGIALDMPVRLEAQIDLAHALA